MKHKIDLFENNLDERFKPDKDKNAKILNIVFQGGTFGNFLKYFLDKFSKHSPDIYSEPFTEIGTSHNIDSRNFSGLIQRYHPSFIDNNKNETDLPVCLILPKSKKHYLYLKKAQWFRGGDRKMSPDHLWSTAVGELPDLQRREADKIMDLYDIKERSHFTWIPKFIVRDWYKLEFLLPLDQTYNYQYFDLLNNHPFFKVQKTFCLDLETFFNWDTLRNNLVKLNNVFDLELDFGRDDEMKYLFEKSWMLDTIRQECQLAEDVCDKDLDVKFRGLDVSTEAFIYSEYEKRNHNIQMPLTNRFFRDTEEIRQFLEHFPNWYRRTNPNIPRK
jgi:hypothetical protein